MRACKELACTAEAGLHFIRNKDNAMPAADLGQGGQKSGGRDDEAAFAEHRFDDDRCDGIGGDHATENAVEQLLHLLVTHRGATAQARIRRYSERNAINVGQEWPKALFVRMGLAGESEAKHGAPVESIFDAQHRRAADVSARNLYRVLDSLSAAIHEKGLLREVAGRQMIELLGQFNIAFVSGDRKAEVEKSVELGAQRLHHACVAM